MTTWTGSDRVFCLQTFRRPGPSSAFAQRDLWSSLSCLLQGWVILLRDDGPGLVAGLAGRLFEPLANGGASVSLGLGLSVSRQLARAMGGDLRL